MFTAFSHTEKSSVKPGPGDGKTSCSVYGADGYTATVVYRVITPESNGSLKGAIELNKRNQTGRTIKVVVQLRNSNNNVIESQTIEWPNGQGGVYTLYFNKSGVKGEAYYVTINSASCQ